MKKLALTVLVLMLAACSGSTAEEVAEVATGTPSAPAATATADTATADATTAPTGTPVVTNTTVPTATPSPPETVTPTATYTVVPTATPIPLETFGSPIDIRAQLQLYAEAAVIERESGNRYLNGGAILYEDGVFHLFSNFFNSWPGSTTTYYYTSTDGRAWQRALEEPLFTVADVPVEGRGALVLDGLILPDGTWVLYYHTFTSGSTPGFIGRATAPGPLGPWHFDETPVLSPGSQGEWDDTQVMRVNVLPLDEGFVMYYAGTTGQFDSAIGMATSSDGISWQKYDDPTTTEAPFAESDPIMQAAVPWEGERLGRPEVLQTEDGWVMLYEGGRGSQTGLAISDDGLNFRRYEANPLLDRENMVENYTFFQGAFFHQDDTYYYLIEAGNGRIGTDIFLYTFTGSLFGE